MERYRKQNRSQSTQRSTGKNPNKRSRSDEPNLEGIMLTGDINRKRRKCLRRTKFGHVRSRLFDYEKKQRQMFIEGKSKRQIVQKKTEEIKSKKMGNRPRCNSMSAKFLYDHIQGIVDSHRRNSLPIPAWKTYKPDEVRRRRKKKKDNSNSDNSNRKGKNTNVATQPAGGIEKELENFSNRVESLSEDKQDESNTPEIDKKKNPEISEFVLLEDPIDPNEKNLITGKKKKISLYIENLTNSLNSIKFEIP